MQVSTTKGILNTEDLEYRTGSLDDDNEHTVWEEYWLDGELVHRSAHVTLKKPIFLAAETANFS